MVTMTVTLTDGSSYSQEFEDREMFDQSIGMVKELGLVPVLENLKVTLYPLHSVFSITLDGN